MKRFLTLLLVLCLVGLFAGCSYIPPQSTGSSNSSTSSSGTEVTPPDIVTAEDVIEQINAFLAQNYTTINISVNTKNSAFNLTDTFKITFGLNKKTVEYSITKLNQITVSGDQIVLPESQKTTYTGVCEVLNDGTVNFVSGDEVNYDFSSVGMPKITLDIANLTETAFTKYSFSANVVSVPTLFNNQDMVAAQGEIMVNFAETLTKLTVTYVNQDGYTIKAAYSFTK